MEKIRAIIVEDELLACRTLIQKIKLHCSEIEIVASCEDAESALTSILQLHPELIFLDIHLPNENGLWLAQRLSEMKCETFSPPAIIFTTAFDESKYLLSAIKLAAIDYLIKPILIEDLQLSIQRFIGRKSGVPTFSDLINSGELLSFKNLGGIMLLRTDEIVYIKADGNYVEMFLERGDREEIFERLGEIEKRLQSTSLKRVGKSFIINLKYLRQINTRKSVCRLATAQASFDIPMPNDSLKVIKELLPLSMRHTKL